MLNKLQPNHIPPKSSKSVWRAIAAPNADLSADEAASTFYRFFRSKHVADLRLIALLALIFLVFDVAIVLGLGCIELALSDADPAKAWKEFIDFAIKYIGAAIPICGGIVAWTYLSASSRLGIVDLFACEIGTLCRVGTIVDVGKRYVDQAGAASTDQHTMFGERSSSSGNFVSQENYFPVFASNSKELQPLEVMVVTHITEFYTFMKAMRDSQRKLAETKLPAGANPTPEILEANAKVRGDILANIIFMMFLGYESARKAVRDLIEFEPTATEVMMVLLITELKCYCFLVEYFNSDDLRRSRLELREEEYKVLIPHLLEKVDRLHKANPKDWERAARTVPELKRRYEEVCFRPHAIRVKATEEFASAAP